MRSFRVFAKVTCLTDFGKQCLNEIKGLKEGTYVRGLFHEANNSLDIKVNGMDACLWVGENCVTLTDKEMKKENPKMYRQLLKTT